MPSRCPRCHGTGIIHAVSRTNLSSGTYTFLCSHNEIKPLRGIPYWDHSKESHFIAEFTPEFATFQKSIERPDPVLKPQAPKEDPLPD